MNDIVLSPCEDPGWLLMEEGADPARGREIESIFTIGNGYLGVGASIAEGSRFSRPAPFLAGLYVADGARDPGSRCFRSGVTPTSRWKASDCRSKRDACSRTGERPTGSPLERIVTSPGW